jgi:TRAP-type C4-dicarboxylate transport system substrate-binding protein
MSASVLGNRFRVLIPLLLALILCAGPARAAGVKLRFANFPGASTFPCIAMERWADELRAKVGGAVDIETYPGGTLLEAKNMVRGVMMGQADIGCISLAYHPGAYPFLSVFELPLGFASAEAVSEVMWDVVTGHSPAEVEKVKVIAVFSSSPSQILSSKPLRGPEDLRGLVLRSSGILADVAATFGASPVSMPQSDTPEALQKGVVEGVFTSFDVLKDYNFAESCRYGMIVDMPVYPMMFFMNQKTWDALPGEVRDAIMAIAPEHSVWTGRYVDAHGREALRWSEETYGYQVTELDAAQNAALMEQARPVIDAWLVKAAERGIDGKALLDEVMAAKKAVEERMVP